MSKNEQHGDKGYFREQEINGIKILNLGNREKKRFISVGKANTWEGRIVNRDKPVILKILKPS